MILHSLTTEGYRNLAGQTLELCDGVNLLYGKNAAGKTNTLECAYLFASGRSFRTRREAEFIRRGADSARAEICFERAGFHERMALFWQKDTGRGSVKRMLYQGSEVSKASEFLGIFRAVLFTPDHLSLIKGSPEERRRFMDIALSQLGPRYVRCMNEYIKVLSQKNNYLRKAAFEGRADDDYLDVLDSLLAKSAAVLVRQRNGFAEKLDEFAGAFYAGLSGKRERLKVKYISATKRHFDDDAYTETSLISLYRADRESDLRAGRTLHGPHKDDLLVYIAGSAPETELAGEPDERVREEEVSEFAARTFGSQGQQRSAVLAIKLAEGEIFKSLTGEYPVFLLDDLLGELDAERRSFLVRLIRDRQAVISCCDRTALPDGTDVAAVHVVDGRYEPE